MTGEVAADPPWDTLLEPVRFDLRPAQYPRTLATLTDALGTLLRHRGVVRVLPPPADPAWAMLLALFGAHARGERRSVSELCAWSGAPLTTAFRMLLRMEDLRMITRTVDVRDHRRSLVWMSDDTRMAMVEALEAFVAALRDGTD